jgi:hypothetical protein
MVHVDSVLHRFVGMLDHQMAGHPVSLHSSVSTLSAYEDPMDSQQVWFCAAWLVCFLHCVSCVFAVTLGEALHCGSFGFASWAG